MLSPLRRVSVIIVVSLLAFAGILPAYAAQSPGSTTVHIGGLPTGVDVDPVLNHVFAATLFPNQLVMLDATTAAPLTTSPIDGNAWSVAVDPITHRAYAGATGLAIYDAKTGQPIIDQTTLKPLTVHVPSGTFAIAINARTHRVYTAASGVTVVDGMTRTDAYLANAPNAVVNAGGIATDPVTNRVFVTGSSNNTLTVLDGATLAVRAVVPTGLTPHALAVDPIRQRVYVANVAAFGGSASITVVDSRTLTTVATWPMPGGVEGVAVDLLGGRVFATEPSRGVVALLGPTGTELTTWPAAGYPYRVAVNLFTGRAYVTNFTGDLYMLEPLMPRFSIGDGRQSAPPDWTGWPVTR